MDLLVQLLSSAFAGFLVALVTGFAVFVVLTVLAAVIDAVPDRVLKRLDGVVGSRLEGLLSRPGVAFFWLFVGSCGGAYAFKYGVFAPVN